MSSRFAAVALTLTFPIAADADLTPAERAAGWEVVFDGTSTDALRGYRKPGFPTQGWVVEDGALRCVAGGGGGDIITKAQYEDFELSLEWMCAPKANSGIMWRVTEEHGAPWQTGPEMQILDDHGHNLDATNGHSTGALYDLVNPPANKILHPAGEWNHGRVVVRDGMLRQYLNGVKVVEIDMDGEDFASLIAASKFKGYDGFGVRKVGHICFQDHGNDVWFRDIKIRDLDAPLPGEIDLFAGDRLDQWTFHLRDGGAMDDVWSWDGDVLQCKGRPIGYIRTNADYTNFVLRLQWRFDPVTKQEGNSGVLLRMVGEDTVWPRSVEAQLMSKRAGDFWNIGEFVMSTVDGRRNGRHTAATHHHENAVGEWNDYEIIVDGGRVELWVNGELLNEAWDVEEIPGKICLQSEGAPIHFRNMRLAEIRE